MYADDTCFLINSTDLNTLLKQLNVELKSHCTVVLIQQIVIEYSKKLSYGFSQSEAQNSEDINMDVIMDNRVLSKVGLSRVDKSQFN